MKVLVVESNIVMTEIITDVLTVDGFQVFTAATAAEAKVQFGRASPNIVIFDVDAEGCSIVSFFASVKATESMRVIALCSSISQVPQHPLISANIQKPFKGSEILMAVRKAKGDIEAKNGKLKKFSSLFSGIFGAKKKQTETKVQAEISSEPTIPVSKSYLVFEKEPSKVYELSRMYHTCDQKILVMTKNTIKATRAKYPADMDVEIVGITKKAREGYISYSKIGSIMGTLGDYTSKNIHSIVVIEGVEEMIDYHGMNTVITMLCQLVDNGNEKGTMFLVSVKSETFSQNEKDLLLHHLDVFDENGISTLQTVGTSKPEVKQPEVGQSEAKQPEIQQTGTEQPVNKQPEVKQP